MTLSMVVAPYALEEVVRAFTVAGYTRIIVTMEDNDLLVVINTNNKTRKSNSKPENKTLPASVGE